MNHPNYTTEHKKGQHLLSEERHEIEVRRKDGWSIYRIAKHLGRPYNTIKNEIVRGTVSLYNGKVQRYKADEGKKVYRKHRQNCRKQYRCLSSVRFLQYVAAHLRGKDKWSLDACYGAALSSGAFRRDEMVCTKTLYNYVDLGLLPIKNIDLPEKLRRNTKRKKVNENRRVLGKSIDERPENVALRIEFGHWELDSVIGKKKEGEPVVLTLTERKTRMCIWLKAREHSAEAASEALRELFARFGDLWHELFKTITIDNGSEFALLTELEDGELKVYFTHPYTSCEKGTNECHNRMLRRFIPKGKSVADYSAEDICFFADCINSLPRKILGYATPETLFDAQFDRTIPLEVCRSAAPQRDERGRAKPDRENPFAFYRSCYYFENYCNLLMQFAKKNFSTKQIKQYLKQTKKLSSALGIGSGGKTARRMWYMDCGITTALSTGLNEMINLIKDFLKKVMS